MIYSLWVVLIALTFWFVKFDNNVTIMQALMDSGRYPVDDLPALAAADRHFMVPIAVATTVPAAGAARRPEWQPGAAIPGDRAGGFLMATRVWKAGVRHYSGASS